MERDGESGNDHTLFRMYASNLGRWLSPDPVAGDISNPQSLNRYAYVMNNPTTLTDPLGLQGVSPPGCPSGMPLRNCFGGIPGFFGGGTPLLLGWQTWDKFDLIFPTTFIPGGNGDEGQFITGIDPNGLLFALLMGERSTSLTILPLPTSRTKMLQSLLPSCLSVTGQSVDSYLEHYNSRMVGQGNNFVSAGIHYGVDPRFTVALAGAESSFGKNTNKTWGVYNAFGWTGGTSWTNWAQGLWTVTRGIGTSRYYMGGGLVTTKSIYANYCKGPGCAQALRNLNTFLTEQGGNPSHVTCP